MRIVGGAFRGRVLEPFEKIGVRPTSDMVRESLFNILQFRIMGACFLDLFCGTGAMGIEALSRGAKRVVLNDSSLASVKLAKKNIEKLKICEGIEVVNFDAFSFLQRTTEKFDIIYIDPPYASDLGEKALYGVKDVLNDDGIAILESETAFSGDIEGLNVYDNRKYGRAHLTFFKKGE